MSEYRTVRTRASAEFTEKRSRFIGHIIPVTAQDEAVAFINEIKSKHWDATHNVYAYVLREGMTRRYSDDGEPQGTAGIPVLDVLLKESLTDCCVVVTRYFGGVMLGAGGLVRAYSHSSKIAVDAGGIVTMSSCNVHTLSTDYNLYGKVSALIPECGGIIDDTQFTDTVKIVFKMPEQLSAMFEDKLCDLSFGRIKSEIIGNVFSAID